VSLSRDWAEVSEWSCESGSSLGPNIQHTRLMRVVQSVHRYFQKSWSGVPFKNNDWAVKNGDGKIWLK
jgi:hypothetical protein